MAVSGGYFPVYPHHDSLPDPEIRTFITNFYRASDRPDANELWVSYFTKDADVHIGKNRAEGEQSTCARPLSHPQTTKSQRGVEQSSTSQGGGD